MAWHPASWSSQTPRDKCELLFPDWILWLLRIPLHQQWTPWSYSLASTSHLPFLSSHPLMSPLHFQFSTAAALVKVTVDFSIAKASGHCSANLTQSISSFDLKVDLCLPLGRFSSTDLWDTTLLLPLLLPWLLLLKLPWSHPRISSLCVLTLGVISLSPVASDASSMLTTPKFNSVAQTSPQTAES